MGGELNACYNAVDRHVLAGNGDKVALIHDSPQTSTIRKVTYNELLDKTSLLAGALADMGVGKGDAVIIYMPLIPETIIAILATTRLGAVHSVVFGGKTISTFLKVTVSTICHAIERRTLGIHRLVLLAFALRTDRSICVHFVGE